MEQNPQVIFKWKAPLRPYRKKNKLILRFYIALSLILSLIFFFFGDKILLIPVWALLFLFYVLTITPPPEVENKITVFGIESAGITIRWEVLSHFYFIKRFNFYVLTIVSHPPFISYIYLVVPNEEIKKKLIEILSEHLIYQEKPQRNLTDKIVDWLTRLIPEEEENENEEKSKVVLQKPSPVLP